ncbi:MAG: DUF4058 family protein [Chloroflexota bacterium]
MHSIMHGQPISPSKRSPPPSAELVEAECPPFDKLRGLNGYISEDLNQHLPKGYFAESNVQFGIEMETTSAESLWVPPSPTQTVPLDIETDILEVSIFSNDAGPVLVGAIELVSPANKDRAAHRDTFVSKCETFLRQGIGLVIVDIVTNRKANLHGELLQRLGVTTQSSNQEFLYASAYHPVELNQQNNLDIWHESLHVGQPLPTMPLWLRGEMCVPLNLEETYEKTCRTRRIVD